MKTKGFVITITALYFVMLFLLFLSFIVTTQEKNINTDVQKLQNYQNYVYFNQGLNDIEVDFLKDHWCSVYYYYNNEIKERKYCEEYDKKRFI